MSVRQSNGFPLSVSIQTDVGKVRSNNEDSHGDSWLNDDALLVIVADGMGGHEAGEVASGLAVRVLKDVLGRDVSVDPRERLYNGLLEANQAIIDEGQAAGSQGMGTTAIVGVFNGPQLFVGLIGDSRLYHFRQGQMLWRTLDHTRVQMLLEQGEISEEEARNHPESGMLTRALGHARMADGRPLVPDVLAEPLVLEPDDLLVLSTDGLHDLLEDWEIGQIASGLAPEEAATKLVAEALERGGHDNITVAVVACGATSAPYDSNFEPIAPELDLEDADVEETYDAFLSEEVAAVVQEAQAELDDTPKSRGMMLGVVAMLMFVAVLLGLAAIAGLIILYIWMMG